MKNINTKKITEVIKKGIVILGITTTLTACSSETKNETNKTDINQEFIDAIKNGESFTIGDNGIISKSITVDELKESGAKLELTSSCSPTIGYGSIYRIDSLNLKKLPNNVLFEDMVSFTKNNNVKLDTNITWDDCIEEIKNKNIDEKYKKILVNAVEKYKTLGLEKGLPILYDNIKNSRFYSDNNYDIAFFDTEGKRLVVGRIDVNDYPELKTWAKESGMFSEEEYELLLTEHEYILTHEFGHMISSYYDPKSHKIIENKNYYAVVNPENNDVDGIIQLGKFTSEGFADYMVYETLNRKPTKIYGYPINQCFYLMMKEMFGLNSIEELRTLDFDKVVQKLKELGFENPFESALLLEDSVNEDYKATSSPFYQIEMPDYTGYMCKFFEEYYNAQINNGVSKDEIKEVFEKIINDMKERVYTSVVENELCVQGTGGRTLLSISCLEDSLDDIINPKMYLK